jgi:hypothetical protein
MVAQGERIEVGIVDESRWQSAIPVPCPRFVLQGAWASAAPAVALCTANAEYSLFPVSNFALFTKTGRLQCQGNPTIYRLLVGAIVSYTLPCPAMKMFWTVPHEPSVHAGLGRLRRCDGRK